MWLMPSALEQTLWPVFGPRRLTVAEDEQGKGVFEYDKPSSFLASMAMSE
jgi:hypothetical protein